VQDDAARHAQAALPRLWSELEARKQVPPGSSYTRTLLDAGAPKIGAKIREEADELARAIADESDARVVSEAADELYHVLVGLLSRGVDLRAVEAELARRFGMSGLAEKASRAARAKD
jgi:phosphoribosyl-ATP pyrophosphohydrolase/phosphoribosyl-AMP cyclohydrolase